MNTRDFRRLLRVRSGLWLPHVAAGGDMGEYDDNWNWVPTSDQVYAFDCEVFNERHVHGFMNGVIAISGGEFAITDIEEDTSQVDYDKTRKTDSVV